MNLASVYGSMVSYAMNMAARTVGKITNDPVNGAGRNSNHKAILTNSVPHVVMPHTMTKCASVNLAKNLTQLRNWDNSQDTTRGDTT